MEIKGGETYNKDFIKNLIRFPDDDTHHGIEKVVFYTGKESFKIKDIEIIPFTSFSKFLNETGG